MFKAKISLWFVIALMCLIIGISAILNYRDPQTTREIISETLIEIDNNPEKGITRSKYVFTKENTYKVEDLLFINVRSLDTYRTATINKGKECDIESRGTRIGYLSMFRVITSIKNCK